jgi:hypothetical protein
VEFIVLLLHNTVQSKEERKEGRKKGRKGENETVDRERKYGGGVKNYFV